MRSRMRYALVTTSLITTLSLVACSSGGTTPSDDDTPADSGAGEEVEPVTLTFWSGMTGGDKDAYLSLIQDFNDTHTDIQVDYVLQPWDSIAQKLPTAIAAGSGPDLATPDYNMATVIQYADNGLALPLDDLLGTGETQVDESALPSTLIDAFSIDGHMYASPLNFSTLLLYYNTDLFSAAGLEPPTTMDELREAATQLTTADGQYGIAIGDHSTIAVWPILIWAEGGDLVTDGCSALNDSATVAAVSEWAELIHSTGITPTGLAGQDADNLFAAGKAAMEINGANAAGQYTEAGVNFDVVPVPVGSSDEPVTLGNTIPVIVSANTEHPAEAQEFLAWWLSADTQANLSQRAGTPPTRNDLADDPRLAENPLVQKFSAVVDSARFYLPTEPAFNQIDADIFSPAIQAATLSGDAAGPLATANDQLNEVLGCQ